MRPTAREKRERKQKQKDDTFASKVSFNMGANILRTLIMALFGFLMVPYYIDELGLATYAILPLITSVSTYVLAVTDPLGDAFARYTAVAVQGHDMEGASKAYSSSMAGMAAVVLMLMPVVVIISMLAPYVFNVEGGVASEVQLLFALILISSLLVSFSASMGAIFTAYNKLYYVYISKTVYCVLQVVFVILFFVLWGSSLVLIGISYFIAAVVMLAMMWYGVHKLTPDVRLSMKFYDRELLRKMGRLGVWATMAEFGTLMYIEASIIIVNICLGAFEQGNFSIAANMISMINTATTSLAAVSVPLIYRAYANRDHHEIVATLKLFMKFVGVLMAFPIAYILIYRHQIIDLWLGGGYGVVEDMLLIMLPMEVAFCTSRTLLTVPLVYERMRAAAIITWIFGIFNIIAAMFFLTFTDLGVMGVCWAWAISMFLLKVVFYPIYSADLAHTRKREFYYPEIISYAMFFLVYLLLWGLDCVWELPETWLAVLLWFGVLFVVYFLLAMRFLFNKEEKHMFAHYLPTFVQHFINR